MFDLLTKYSVWDMMPDPIKENDLDTTQFLYEAENRGQTQRYLVVVGQLIKELFTKIEELQDWGTSDHQQSEFLDKIVKLYGMLFFEVGVTDLVKRELLDEIVWFWKLKGTVASLKWITYKVFGWKVIKSTSIEDLIQYIYDPTGTVPDGFLYDDTEIAAGQKFLYSSKLMDWSLVALTIDVLSDPSSDYAEKKTIFARLYEMWGFSPTTAISWVNEP